MADLRTIGAMGAVTPQVHSGLFLHGMRGKLHPTMLLAKAGRRLHLMERQ